MTAVLLAFSGQFRSKKDTAARFGADPPRRGAGRSRPSAESEARRPRGNTGRRPVANEPRALDGFRVVSRQGFQGLLHPDFSREPVHGPGEHRRASPSATLSRKRAAPASSAVQLGFAGPRLRPRSSARGHAASEPAGSEGAGPGRQIEASPGSDPAWSPERQPRRSRGVPRATGRLWKTESVDIRKGQPAEPKSVKRFR